MIGGGWAYVWGAYALTVGLLGALALIVAMRSTHWAERARKLEERKPP